MKFRKLVLCMLVGIILMAFTGNDTYAAEEGTVVKEEIITLLVNTADITTKGTETTNSQTMVEDDKNSASLVAITETSIEKEAVDKTAVDIEETEEVKEKVEVKEEVKKEVKVVEKKVTPKQVAKYTKAELRLLSALIYCEANGESYKGKLAVGIVVMNRKESNSFPDTIRGVIYQKYQFGPVTNGSLKKALAEYDNGKFTSDTEKSCIRAAKAALNGTKIITVNGTKKNFGKYLFFSCRLRNHTYQFGNHQFK